jgi:hypothetical protein
VDFLSFFDSGEIAEDDDANLAGVEVLGQAQSSIFETQQFIGHHRRQSFDLGDAIAGGTYAAYFNAFGVAGLVGCRKLVQRITDVFGVDGQFGHLQSLLSCVVISAASRRPVCESVLLNVWDRSAYRPTPLAFAAVQTAWLRPWNQPLRRQPGRGPRR